MSALTVTYLHGGYRPAVDVVRGIDMSVEPGTAVGLIGRNGAGKTCLAELLIGRNKATRGTIRLGDDELTGLRPDGRVRRGLSLVPEGRLVFPQLTVRENLITAAYGAGRKLDPAEIRGIEERFEVLGRKRNDRAGGMSGGEQQLLAIARALVQHPRVIVLDEPSLGLAPVMVHTVRDVLASLLADGLALVLMEQNRALVAALCSAVHVIQDGVISLTTTPEKLESGEELGDLLLGEDA